MTEIGKTFADCENAGTGTHLGVSTELRREAVEKQQSSVVPLLLVVALVVATVGAGIYFLIQSRQVLTAQEDTNLAVEVLKVEGPSRS